MPLTSMFHTEVGYAAFAAFVLCLFLPAVRNSIRADQSASERRTGIFVPIRSSFGLNEAYAVQSTGNRRHGSPG